MWVKKLLKSGVTAKVAITRLWTKDFRLVLKGHTAKHLAQLAVAVLQ